MSVSDEERREAVEFLRSGTCLYFAEHRKRQLDCSRCMKVSTMLFGHYDALCDLDSCGTDAWRRLADLIDRPTCHLIEDEDGRTACSECGCTALYLPDARYCPDCGSIIERRA